MTTTFTITPEAILHTDIKLMIRNNYTKYLNHRHKYVFYCTYDLFWEKQGYLNKLIQDVVAEFGMMYLVVPSYDSAGKKKIAIIFDTSHSLFDDTMTGIIIDEKNSSHLHCENQRKEINLLLKQKEKLVNELEECKNDKFDMMAYRDDIIGKISREKNELENANKVQTRRLEEMDESIKKGNEQYKTLQDKYDRVCYDRTVINEKYDKLSKDYDALKEKYEDKKHLINSVYGFKQRDLEKANDFYRNKVHELFDMLLAAEFRQKQEEKEEKKDD